eukprot:gene20736-27552_t
MKLLDKKFEKDMEGYIKVLPEEVEDMWNIFNLIREGDRVTASTFRKVSRDSGTGTDSERVKVKLQIKNIEYDPTMSALLQDSGLGSESERIRLKLKVEIENIEYDPEGGVIRLKGKNMTENEHVKLGAFHTLELELQRAFTLEKDQWDTLDVDRIKQAADPLQSADLAALLITTDQWDTLGVDRIKQASGPLQSADLAPLLITDGLANLCLVGANTTMVCAKIEKSLPRKRGAAIAGYDKAWTKFLDACLTAVLRHVDWNIIKCLVIAGPGFAKDSFKEHMDLEAVRQNIRPLIENKNCIVLAPASTAYKHSLKEVLEVPGIAARIKDTKAAQETQVLADFYNMLSNDSARAFYGPGHVRAAAEMGAIQTLLISDNILRVQNVEKRRKYAVLVEGAEAKVSNRALARVAEKLSAMSQALDLPPRLSTSIIHCEQGLADWDSLYPSTHALKEELSLFLSIFT